MEFVGTCSHCNLPFLVNISLHFVNSCMTAKAQGTLHKRELLRTSISFQMGVLVMAFWAYVVEQMHRISNVTFISLNVRGIRDRVKRKNIFEWCKSKGSDIVLFLQETYSTVEVFFLRMRQLQLSNVPQVF